MRQIGLALLFATILFGLRGYDYGANHHHEQVLPFVIQLIQPDAFAGDPYVATTTQYPSLFPWLTARLARTPQELERVMAALHLINIFLIVSALMALCDRILNGKKHQILAVLLLLSASALHRDSFLGTDEIYRAYADGSTCAWAVMLWAAALWIGRSYRIAFILVGLAANLNPLPALHVGVAFMIGCLLADKRPWQERLKNAAVHLLCMGIAAAPIFARIFMMPPHAQVAAGTALTALKEWFPLHSFPESWPKEKWAAAISYTSLYSYLLVTAPENLRSRLSALWWGAWALIAIGFLGRAIDAYSLIRLQFFRADALLIIVGTLLTAERAAQYLERPMVGDLLTACLLISSAMIWSHWPLALLALSAQLINTHWPQGIFGKVKIPILMRPLLVAGWLFVVFLPQVILISQRLLTRSWSAWDTQAGYRVEEWKSLAVWCRENTKKDSQFIVPPDHPWGFRGLSWRPVVFEWVDGAAMHWDPSFALIWGKRRADFPVSADARAQWSTLDPAHIRRLRDTYHAQYLVAPIQTSPLPFALAWRGEYYCLYRLA